MRIVIEGGNQQPGSRSTATSGCVRVFREIWKTSILWSGSSSRAGVEVYGRPLSLCASAFVSLRPTGQW